MIQAALGTEIEVPTLNGRAHMAIPAGTQNGTIFRLKGKGVKNVQGYGQGDLHVRVSVEVPTHLNSAKRAKLQEFAALCDSRLSMMVALTSTPGKVLAKGVERRSSSPVAEVPTSTYLPLLACIAALRAASNTGLKIHLMHGNRDFALGERFAAAAGARLLPDPFDLVLPEWSFVLSHGDALCLDDPDYTAYRAKVRNPAWLQKMLARPRFFRRQLGRYIRWRSRRRKRDRPLVYADLQPAATDDDKKKRPGGRQEATLGTTTRGTARDRDKRQRSG